MAKESITSLKHIDCTVTIPQNGSFGTTTIAVAQSRIKSLVLLYSDSVYFSSPIVAVSDASGSASNSEVVIKTVDTVSNAANFTVRVFYE